MPVPPAMPDLTGVSFYSEQYVFFADKHRRLAGLKWDGGGWHFLDLAGLTGGPPVQGKPAAHALGDSLHVFYRGTDAHMHEVWLSTTAPIGSATRPFLWRHNDLTRAARVDANVGGAPGTWLIGGRQYVAYVGTDGAVHLLFWDGAWRHHGISAEAFNGAVDPSFQFVGRPVGYGEDGLLASNRTLVRDTLGRLWLFAKGGDGDPWTRSLVSGSAGGAEGTRAASDPCAIVLGSADDPVFVATFTGPARPTPELRYKRISAFDWSGEFQVGRFLERMPPAVGNPATMRSGEMAWVYARTTNGHIFEAKWREDWDAAWTNDVGAQAGVTLAGIGDPACWALGDSRHVVFVGQDAHVHEYWFDRSWHHNDLSAIAR